MVKLVIIFFCYILKYLSLSISLVLYSISIFISFYILSIICEFMVALKDAPQLIRYYIKNVCWVVCQSQCYPLNRVKNVQKMCTYKTIHYGGNIHIFSIFSDICYFLTQIYET